MGKRTQVKCPICGEVKVTRAAKFQHCGIRHETAKNLFYANNDQGTKDKTIPKVITNTKPTKPVINPNSDEIHNSNNDKETTNTKKQPIQKTNENKGVMITLVDEDTNEQLLTTDAAIVMSPDETLFSGEVEATVKRHNNKDNQTTNTTPITNLSPQSSPSFTGSVMGALKNPLVTTGLIGGAGLLLKWYMNRKEKPNPDTDW